MLNQSKETSYTLFYWWEGDNWSDACWIETGNFTSEEELIKGFRKALKGKVYIARKTTVDYFQLPGQEDLIHPKDL